MAEELDHVAQAEPEGRGSTDVLVTVEVGYKDALPDVSRRLRSAGLTDEDVFEFSGVIAGRVAPEDLNKLRAVEGCRCG